MPRNRFLIASAIPFLAVVVACGGGGSPATPTPAATPTLGITILPSPTPTPKPIPLKQTFTLAPGESKPLEFHLVAANRVEGTVKNSAPLDLLITGPKDQVILNETGVTEKTLSFLSVGEGDYAVTVRNPSQAPADSTVSITLYWR